MKSGANLIDVIRSSHSPLPEVVLENVVAISELGWISLSLSWLKSVSTSESSSVVDEISIVSLRWLKPLVVPAWVEASSS